jgi:hypothetical protein
MLPIFPAEFQGAPDFCLISNPNVRISMKPSDYKKLLGVYLYGGMRSDGSLNEHLYVLKTGQYALSWDVVPTKGQPPAARFMHTMSYSQVLNIIAIYGGRSNSHNTPLQCFSDLHILTLDTLTWATVELFGCPVAPRSAHCAGFVGT